MSDKDRLNEALALMDRMYEFTDTMKRIMSRLEDTAVECQEKAGQLRDEYEMLVAKWSDEDEEEGLK